MEVGGGDNPLQVLLGLNFEKNMVLPIIQNPALFLIGLGLFVLAAIAAFIIASNTP
jgi:hypothetical protein